MGASLAGSMAIGAGTSAMNTILTEGLTKDGKISVNDVLWSAALGGGAGFLSHTFGSLIPKSMDAAQKTAWQGIMDSLLTISSSTAAQYISMQPTSAHASEMNNYTPNMSFSDTLATIISPALRIDYYSPALINNFSSYNDIFYDNFTDYIFTTGGSSGGGFTIYFGGTCNF